MDTKREILESVAAGDLSPEEAAERLASTGSESPDPAPTPPPAPGEIKRVRLVAALGSATVVGDPEISDVIAEGDHSVRREGDTMIIELPARGEGEEHGTFRFEKRKFSLKSAKGSVVIGPDSKPVKVSVRMNPALALDADVGAGRLIVRQIQGPIKAEVAMGALRVEGARSPFEIDVAMGSAYLSGILDKGAARVHCDMGSANIELDPGSSVTVKARASMGKVSLPGSPSVVGIGGGSNEAVIGGGDATLDIECAMGAVKVSER